MKGWSRGGPVWHGGAMSKPRPSDPQDQPTTREKLIAAAFAVVGREGMDAASVKIIAAEAGVAPGLLHYHFATKEALLVEALRQALASYVARSRARREATPRGAQIDAYFDEARASVEAEAGFFRVRLAFAARAMTHPDLAAVMRELNDGAVEETALTFAAAAGRDTANARDRALAATLKAAFDGLMLAWLTDPSFPLDDAGEILADAARNWVARS
jgi:AcrR family transcriptional regulator